MRYTLWKQRSCFPAFGGMGASFVGDYCKAPATGPGCGAKGQGAKEPFPFSPVPSRDPHTRISTPLLRKNFFKSWISTCFVWKMEAARPASTPGWVNSSAKCSIFPAPPLAMMGTLTRSGRLAEAGVAIEPAICEKTLCKNLAKRFFFFNRKEWPGFAQVQICRCFSLRKNAVIDVR